MRILHERIMQAIRIIRKTRIPFGVSRQGSCYCLFQKDG